MFGIGSINFKNTAENLAITIVVFLVGAFAGYKVSTVTTEKMIDNFRPIIEKAIDKETIKNEIRNEIELNIDKIKKSDSININIVQAPENNQKPKNVIIKEADPIPEKKKGLFKKVFGKKK